MTLVTFSLRLKIKYQCVAAAAAAAQNASLTADRSNKTSAVVLNATIEATEGVETDGGPPVTTVQGEVENQQLQLRRMQALLLP